MEKGTKIMMIIWSVLAVANFCLGWALPIYFAIPVIVFGVLNLSVVASLIVSALQKNVENVQLQTTNPSEQIPVKGSSKARAKRA